MSHGVRYQLFILIVCIALLGLLIYIGLPDLNMHK